MGSCGLISKSGLFHKRLVRPIDPGSKNGKKGSELDRIQGG